MRKIAFRRQRVPRSRRRLVSSRFRLIKINDALGFMYKLEEDGARRTEPRGLGPWALELGMLASIGEVRCSALPPWWARRRG